jgi:hypothetical protein
MKDIMTLSELRNSELPEPIPLVEGILHQGETVLVVGRPKMGKSRLVQQLTISLSRGEPFLGHGVPEPRKVLLVDLENRPAGVKKRFSKLSEPSEADQRIFIYAPDTLADEGINTSAVGILRIGKMLESSEADVLIIDTWRLFVTRDENKSEVIVDALKQLSSLRKKRPNLALVIVHHLRKEKSESPLHLRSDPYAWVEGVSGHHALVSHVDACFGLEREGNDLIAFGGVARNSVTSTQLLEEDIDTLRFEVANGEQAAKAVMTLKEKEFWGIAKEMKQFTFTALKEKAATKNKKALSTMLRKAEEHGILSRDDASYVVVVSN